jgi:nucleoside-diphosphate-sugar epimerase
MRMVVKGCAGFIGSHFTDVLLANGNEVVGIDRTHATHGPRGADMPSLFRRLSRDDRLVEHSQLCATACLGSPRP